MYVCYVFLSCCPHVLEWWPMAETSKSQTSVAQMSVHRKKTHRLSALTTNRTLAHYAAKSSMFLDVSILLYALDTDETQSYHVIDIRNGK